MRLVGNATAQDKVPLTALGLKEMPTRVLINALDDVLCTSDSK